MKRTILFRFVNISFLPIIAFIFLIIGCGRPISGDLPIRRIQKILVNVPTYSIILEDMKEEGNFFKTYFHKYRVVKENERQATGWLEVPEGYYKRNENFLGMSLATRKEGEDSLGVKPPGYAYVGDSRYGKWRNDNRGGSVWEWYGKYALFSSLFGGWYRPIYMNDYNSYNSYRSRKQPFFGRNKEFGSSGSIAKRTKPNFFARHMAKQRSGRSSFANKVSSRIGRTKTGFRGRSGGFGK